YFAQHQLEFLRADESPLQHMARLAPQELEQKLRDYLGGFGFQAIIKSGRWASATSCANQYTSSHSAPSNTGQYPRGHCSISPRR
ncbi:hypothetical protein MJM99_32690, partial [Salmonella enterica subsp. enterica serovar Kentucky]|nr:hypothetical protein [Salmonella enterica subsp. enterica serovar Kentucky]